MFLLLFMVFFLLSSLMSKLCTFFSGCKIFRYKVILVNMKGWMIDRKKVRENSYIKRKLTVINQTSNERDSHCARVCYGWAAFVCVRVNVRSTAVIDQCIMKSFDVKKIFFSVFISFFVGCKWWLPTKFPLFWDLGRKVRIGRRGNFETKKKKGWFFF